MVDERREKSDGSITEEKPFRIAANLLVLETLQN